MPSIYVPKTFPRDMSERTEDDQACHNRMPCSAAPVLSAERAAVHLAAMRPLCAPASVMGQGFVAATTWRKRIAVGLYDRTACSIPIFAGDFECDLTVAITSTTDPIGVTQTVRIPRTPQYLGVHQWIAVGTGAAQAPTFDTIVMVVTPLTAGVTPRLLAWTVVPMPTVPPYQATITI